MRKFSSLFVLGICMAFFWGPLGTLDLSGQEYKWKARSDISPPVKVPAQMQKNVNEWICEGNAMLETLIRNLREWDEERIRKELPTIIQNFAPTYLRFPMLELDLGKRLGWYEIIWELDRIADQYEVVSIDLIEVEAFELGGDFQQKMGVDYRMDIATHLKLGETDPILRGCGLHRTTCTPIECR